MKQTIRTFRNLWQRSAFAALTLLILSPVSSHAVGEPTLTQSFPRRDRLKNTTAENVGLNSFFSGATGYTTSSSDSSVVAVSITGGNNLKLDYQNVTGTATVTATNLAGPTSTTFVVQLWDAVTGGFQIGQPTKMMRPLQSLWRRHLPMPLITWSSETLRPLSSRLPFPAAH